MMHAQEAREKGRGITGITGARPHNSCFLPPAPPGPLHSHPGLGPLTTLLPFLSHGSPAPGPCTSSQLPSTAFMLRGLY